MDLNRSILLQMTENNSNPDRTAFIAFVIAVIVLGVNFVAVRFSNQELPPFWGASLRFIVASILLFGIVRSEKYLICLSGAALTGAVLFGLFSFAISYAFLYWGLTQVSSGMASVLFATIPLITQLIASLIGQERLTWKGILGALIVIAGIAVVFMEQLKFDVPLIYMGAVLLGVISSALSGIVVKQYPRSHPVSTNVVGMGIGAILLLLLSVFSGEIPVPASPARDLAGAGMVDLQLHRGICLNRLAAFALERDRNFLYRRAYAIGDSDRRFSAGRRNADPYLSGRLFTGVGGGICRCVIFPARAGDSINPR